MKKMFFYAAALFMTAVGFTACTAEDEVFPPAVVNIAEEEVEVSAQGGAVTLNLTAPSDVVYSVQTPEWISLNEEGIVARGVNSSNTLNFNVAPTQTCQERTGVIRIVAGGLEDSLVVVQEGLALAVDVNNVTIPAAGEEFEITLVAAPGYTVSCPDWIVKGEAVQVDVQTSVLTFTATENAEPTARAGEIVIACGDACGQEVKITVAQKAGLDLTKMVKYSGKMISDAFGDEYDATIGLVWDENDPTLVTVCNLDPFFATNGLTVDAGFNYVQAYYLAEDNMIAIPFESTLNVTLNDPNYGLMDFSVGALDAATMADAENYDHAYFQLSEDKSTITIANALCTLVTVNGEPQGIYDAYRGGMVFTKVAE